MQIEINGKTHRVPPLWQRESLLHLLRDHLGLTGTKYGCGVGSCGACTVLVDGEAQRSCSLPASAVRGQSVTTIEGLAPDGGLHPLQQAWLEERVAQCGYCQAGQIMQAASLLRETPDPDDAEIRDAMEGNLCRCGSYTRIAKAIKRAAGRSA